MEVAEVAATRRRRALRQLGRQGDEDLAAVETLDCRYRCLLAVEHAMAGAHLPLTAAGRPPNTLSPPHPPGGAGPSPITLAPPPPHPPTPSIGPPLPPFG